MKASRSALGSSLCVADLRARPVGAVEGRAEIPKELRACAIRDSLHFHGGIAFGLWAACGPPESRTRRADAPTVQVIAFIAEGLMAGIAAPISETPAKSDTSPKTPFARWRSLASICRSFPSWAGITPPKKA